MIIPIVVIITVFIINFSFDSSEIKSDVLFHATLADPDLYTNGVYIDKFTISKGEYFFRFVPNGNIIGSVTVDILEN